MPFGWSTGGASGIGPSSLYLSLPFRNWQDDPALRGWIEEFVDAIGLYADIFNARSVSSTARANLLDPTYTPTEVASASMATATAPPTGATSTDTMLDVLCYIAGIPTPVDTNLTTAQKQALVVLGWDLLKRKGTRRQILRFVAALSDGIVYGLTPTSPAWQFSVAVPDGQPSPGWGAWVPSTTSLTANQRPWLFSTIRNHWSERLFPAWVEPGVGYSQFRAGYSAVGEPVFASAATMNLLLNEHFSAWTAGVPDNWTVTGTATLNQATTYTQTNWEFTDYCAEVDLTVAAGGVFKTFTQTALKVNNQLVHRVQIDYAYRGSPAHDKLSMRVLDETNTLYWNTSTSAWQSTAYDIPCPVSTSSTTRTRYAFDVTMSAASASTTTKGTGSVAMSVTATSDGTATSQTTYAIFRVGIYEKFSNTVETAAGGERLLWMPLIDALSRGTGSIGASVAYLEPANYQRSAYKTIASTQPANFPYHPALTARGQRFFRAWTNLLKDSMTFAAADWTHANCTRTAASTISPEIGETVATAPDFQRNASGAAVRQSNIIADPSSKSYIAGCYVKKLSADSVFTDVALRLVASGGVTDIVKSFTLTQAQGWQLLPMGAVTFVAGDAAKPLQFEVQFCSSGSNGQVALAGAYVYDVTSKTGVLYPPIAVSPAGGTGGLGAHAGVAVDVASPALDGLMRRPVISLSSGLLKCTVVPAFDARNPDDTGCQPNGGIFNVQQTGTRNRLWLYVGSTHVVATLYDDGTNARTAQVQMSNKTTGLGAGVCTWLRDISIDIYLRWDVNTGLFLSVGEGSAQTTTGVPWTVSGASLGTPTIGYDGTAPFDGIIRNFEIIAA